MLYIIIGILSFVFGFILGIFMTALLSANHLDEEKERIRKLKEELEKQEREYGTKEENGDRS